MRISTCFTAAVLLFAASLNAQTQPLAMSASIEAQAAVAGAATTGKPIWVAWSLADHATHLLRSGETVASAVAAVSALPVSGFLLNCCSPESITAAMPALEALTERLEDEDELVREMARDAVMKISLGE